MNKFKDKNNIIYINYEYIISNYFKFLSSMIIFSTITYLN